jgi:hypothetical protein
MDTSSGLAAFMASKMDENEAVDLAVEASQKKAGIKEDEDPKDSEIKDIRFDIELCKKSKSANLRSEFSDIIRKGQKAIKDIYKPVNEVRVDRDVEERIEGLLNRELKRKFLFAFEDLYDDLIEEDPFHVEDVIDHLSNEMYRHLKSFQDTGDKLAGMEESDSYVDEIGEGAMQPGEADLEAGVTGNMDAYTEEVSKGKVSMKDVVLAIIKDTNATNPEVQAYIDSLTNDIKLNGKEAYADYEIDDYIEDFKNYVADKSLQEHFGRFMKDYQ